MDESGWVHIGTGAEWNWAAGSEWASAAEAVPGWPPAATLPPPVPIQTKNPFQALEDRCIIDSGGAQIILERICCVDAFVKPTKPSKKRRGRRPLFCTAT